MNAMNELSFICPQRFGFDFYDFDMYRGGNGVGVIRDCTVDIPAGSTVEEIAKLFKEKITEVPVVLNQEKGRAGIASAVVVDDPIIAYSEKQRTYPCIILGKCGPAKINRKTQEIFIVVNDEVLNTGLSARAAAR